MQTAFKEALRAMISIWPTWRADLEGVRGIHARVLEFLSEQTNEMLADWSRRYRTEAEACIEDVMIEFGCIPAWQMSFPDFLNRPKGTIIPGQ